MSKRVVSPVVLAVFLHLAGCSGGGDDPPVRVEGLTSCSVAVAGHYYIAGLFPFEGVLPIGQYFDNVAVQAVAEINEAGGIHGESLGLVRCDTKGTDVAARSVMQEVAGAPAVSAVMGPLLSAEVLPAAEVAAAEGLALISPSATSPAITELDDGGWVNRSVSSDALQGAILAAIAEREALGKVFVIYVDDPYGRGLSQVFLDEHTGRGGTAESVAFAEDQPNYARTAVDAAVAYAPEAVLLVGFPTASAAIVRTAIDLGFAPERWLFPDGLKAQEFVDDIANDGYLEGSLGTLQGSPTGPDWEAFRANYQALWGEEPFAFGGNTYDAAYLLAIAMSLADDPADRTQVRDALTRTHDGEVLRAPWSAIAGQLGSTDVNYEGISGPVDLDDSGDVVSNVEEWSIAGGALQTVGCWQPDGQPCS